jgi:general secretion pathway protein J
MNTQHNSVAMFKNNGFTLIEIMIAMVVLSMMMLLLFSSLHTANKHWQIGEIRSDKNNELRLASHFIRKQISQAVPLVWVDKNERQLLFSGEKDTLSFTAQLPSHRGGGGLYFLTMHTVDIESSKQLGLHYSLIQPDNAPLDSSITDETDYVDLIENIDEVSFSYFGKEDINMEAQWYDKWPSKKVMPKMVRINLSTTNPDKVWPEIDIPIQNTHKSNLPEFLIVSS